MAGFVQGQTLCWVFAKCDDKMIEEKEIDSLGKKKRNVIGRYTVECKLDVKEKSNQNGMGEPEESREDHGQVGRKRSLVGMLLLGR